MFTALETEEDWQNIKVVKTISKFPNLQKLIYRHFLTNIDFQNVFRNY